MRSALYKSVLVLGIGAFSAAGALAQEASPSLPGDGQAGADPASPASSPSTTDTPNYDALSPGNKMIARSLFDAQGPLDPGSAATETATSPRWTLEQISGARSDGQGWGTVFQQMKADGAVTARNLGQVVSRYHGAPPPNTPAASAPQSILITSATNEASVMSPRASPTSTGGGTDTSTSPARGKSRVSQGVGHVGSHSGTSAATMGAGPSWAGSGITSGNGGGNGGGHARGQTNGRGK